MHFSFLKISLFKDHTQTPKPNVCSYQLPPHQTHRLLLLSWSLYCLDDVSEASRPLLPPRCTVSLLGHCTLHVALHKVELSFTLGVMFVMKKSSVQWKKGGCSQQPRQRGKTVEKSSKNYHQNKSFTREKKEKVNVFMVKRPLSGMNHF